MSVENQGCPDDHSVKIPELSPVTSTTPEDFLLSSYDYELPPAQIAQESANPRDSSRLLVVDPERYSHHIFRDLPQLLTPGDLLVLNNTKVLPARLYGHKLSGAAVEVLLLEERPNHQWLALVKPGKRLPSGAVILFESHSANEHPIEVIKATVLETDRATGGRWLQFDLPVGTSLISLLDLFGHLPLPPYITTQASSDYQTVYAQKPGAIAAPTAGLHFTSNLLSQLDLKGIETTFVTLHVGIGTFRPVEVEDITSHAMHQEWLEVTAETVATVRETQSRGGRVIAVGTTAVRAIETAAQHGTIQPFSGKTNLFIYPGYQWRVVEGMITNFHLPRSSLLMLVSALIGRQRLLQLYQEAIATNYRFYSFGDAMLILPTARI